MANEEQKAERTYQLFISVRVDNVTAAIAQEIEDRIRDVADDYEKQTVTATKSPVIQRG